ncbi:hypothetical protein S83_057804 [Arachis hypogaea]
MNVNVSDANPNDQTNSQGLLYRNDPFCLLFAEPVVEVKLKSSMKEAAAIPYNLRCHGRVVGDRYLRPRQVQVDYSSKRRRSRRRFLRKMRFKFIETTFPYPLAAMKHYNHGLKEEEQYEVTGTRGKVCRYFKKLGYIRLMHFIAEPKYTKNMPNASEDTAKHFYARVHQMPNRETHVDYCKVQEKPSPRGPFLHEVVPLCCETCGLKDLKALESKSLELSAEGEGGKEEYWNGYHTSTPPKLIVARRNPEFIAKQAAGRKKKR